MLIKLILQYDFKFTRLSRDMQMSGGEDQSALRAWNYQHKADIYKKNFFEKWNKLDLDAIICPSFPIAACKLEEINHINGCLFILVLYFFILGITLKVYILQLTFKIVSF